MWLGRADATALMFVKKSYAVPSDSCLRRSTTRRGWLVGLSASWRSLVPALTADIRAILDSADILESVK
jgi:hypothetical protein